VLAGTPITFSLIGTAAATSPAEIYNLLSTIAWYWFAGFVFWNLACFGLWYWLQQQPKLHWAASFRGKVAFFSLSMLILPYLVLPESTPNITNSAITEDYSNPLHQLNAGDARIGNSLYLPEAFPYELPWAIAQYVQAKRVVDAIRSQLPPVTEAYSMHDHPTAVDVVVLVIGESSTRNAWHLFNPQAPATTPKLEARIASGEALFAFSRTLAQTTATRLAVPSIVSQQPLVWPDGTPNSAARQSMISVAIQAGYVTGWFSNQTAVGKHDGIIASYAGEAELW